MKRFDTPADVARMLARHAPRNVEAILDPAVGSGALLKPLLDTIAASGCRVHCIDVDATALADCRRQFSALSKGQGHFVNANFLEWRCADSSFDCIIMNPPFAARKADEVRTIIERPGKVKECSRSVPVELAFVLKSIRLLRPGGRLLAIVPSSVVSAGRHVWFRQYLMQAGRIEYVHELPRFVFKRLDCRVYLFVFSKARGQRQLVMCNHDLMRPEKITVRLSDLSSDLRLDFGYNSAAIAMNTLVKRTKDLDWRPLATLCSVHRGTGNSPSEIGSSYHTTDYESGVWNLTDAARNVKGDTSERGLHEGDLILKRVGRSCSDSLGLSTGVDGKRCSDCLFLLRPNGPEDRDRILFGSRLVLGSSLGRALVERGTGATYVTASALLGVSIPLGAAAKYPKEFRRFQGAVKTQNSSAMRSAETIVKSTIGIF
jgi:SAM-dependent methyltransferase